MDSHKKSRISAADKHRQGKTPANTYKKKSGIVLWFYFFSTIFFVYVFISLLSDGNEGDIKKIRTTRYIFVNPEDPKYKLLDLLKMHCSEKNLCQSVLLRTGAKIPMVYPAYNTDDFVAVYIYDKELTPENRLIWNCKYHDDEHCLTALGLGGLMTKYHPAANSRLATSPEEIQSLSK